MIVSVRCFSPLFKQIVSRLNSLNRITTLDEHCELYRYAEVDSHVHPRDAQPTTSHCLTNVQTHPKTSTQLKICTFLQMHTIFRIIFSLFSHSQSQDYRKSRLPVWRKETRIMNMTNSITSNRFYNPDNTTMDQNYNTKYPRTTSTVHKGYSQGQGRKCGLIMKEWVRIYFCVD